MELIFAGEVSQLHLSVLHRADATDDVGKDLVGGVRLHLVIPPPMGNIVGIMGQEDQVIALAHVQRLDDRLIKLLPGGAVLQL